MEIECWGVGRGRIGHQRSYKVNIQGHVTKKGDLTKNFDQVCVWDDWDDRLYTRAYGQWMLEGRQW